MRIRTYFIWEILSHPCAFTAKTIFSHLPYRPVRKLYFLWNLFPDMSFTMKNLHFSFYAIFHKGYLIETLFPILPGLHRTEFSVSF